MIPRITAEDLGHFLDELPWEDEPSDLEKCGCEECTHILESLREPVPTPQTPRVWEWEEAPADYPDDDLPECPRCTETLDIPLDPEIPEA